MPNVQGLYANMFKGFMPYVQELYANMCKSLMLICSRAIANPFKGLKPLCFKIGPKAILKLVQNQINYMISAFTYALICIMIKLNIELFIYYYSLSFAHFVLCLFCR
ncbi:unnamed protein product [Camellia sinensis]